MTTQELVQRLAQASADAIGADLAEVLSPCRRRELVRARQAVSWVARHDMQLSHIEIGKALGRDAHTIASGLETFGYELPFSPELNGLVQTLRQALRENAQGVLIGSERRKVAGALRYSVLKALGPIITAKTPKRGQAVTLEPGEWRQIVRLHQRILGDAS